MKSVDLTSCDKEQIHLIHSIQGHGIFTAVSKADLKILFISENATSFFDMPEPSKMKVGEKLNLLLPHELFKIIQQKVLNHIVHPVSFVWQNLDVYLYKIDETLIGIEIEKIVEDSSKIDSGIIINNFLESMKVAKDVAELSLFACRAIRTLTGMSRVMLYRFFPPDMYGEVIAEDRTSGSHSFAGHRFPASDIPRPARDLYLKNQVRLINDITTENSPILSGFNKQTNLDLSNSRLRGVSEIHLEYLKNMGVRGSFSVAIKVEGELWGLIACHSPDPVFISHKNRSHCETISNCLALSAPLIEKGLRQESIISFNKRFQDFFVKLKDSLNPYSELFKLGSEVNQIFHTLGFAVVSNDKVNAYGLTPLSEDVLNLAKELNQIMDRQNKRIFVTDALSEHGKEWYLLKDQASGLIALRLNEIDNSLLVFFRPEILQTIHWGGDPRKNFEQRNYQGPINPRASFETWTEVIKNKSEPWLKHEIDGAKNFSDLIFDLLIKNNSLIQELGSKLKMRS